MDSPALSDPRIELITARAAIARCFAVMVQLRPHLRAEEFVTQVTRQQAAGYHLAALESAGQLRCLAGFRIIENLAWGKFCYVDDLITDATARSQGHAQQLFAWVMDYARAAGCVEFHLDSGVQRFPAHRFYLGQRLDITCHHFALALT